LADLEKNRARNTVENKIPAARIRFGTIETETLSQSFSFLKIKSAAAEKSIVFSSGVVLPRVADFGVKRQANSLRKSIDRAGRRMYSRPRRQTWQD
jgi:hypothetical protein